MALVGIFGKPFLALDRYLDLSPLDAIHDEVCLGLSQVPVDYTGGSHRSMGIVPAAFKDECLVDYGEVIRGMNDSDFAVFRSLSDDPESIDADARSTRRGQELRFGEEREHPLSRRQMHWLKVRFGVYFPWKAYVELMPNRYWNEKSDAEGKRFTRQALAFFPRTIAFVQSLPFTHVGRCNIMGLESHDHGTVHRDGEPKDQVSPDHFITFCPRANKRLFLWDARNGERGNESEGEKYFPKSRAYWFNDHDYHGVEAAPYFRYSIRVDGVFKPEFLERLKRDFASK